MGVIFEFFTRIEDGIFSFATFDVALVAIIARSVEVFLGCLMGPLMMSDEDCKSKILTVSPCILGIGV